MNGVEGNPILLLKALNGWKGEDDVFPLPASYKIKNEGINEGTHLEKGKFKRELPRQRKLSYKILCCRANVSRVRKLEKDY